MLYLRLDQAEELVSAARDLKERLVIRYMVYNGLSPMEVSDGRIEHLDPVECTLFLPRRKHRQPTEAAEPQTPLVDSPLPTIRDGGRPPEPR